MIRFSPSLSFVLFLIVLFPAASFPDPADGAEKPKTVETIAGLIKDLVGGKFAAQEKAHKGLLAVGEPAIAPLAKALAAAKTDAVKARLGAILKTLRDQVFLADAPQTARKGLTMIAAGGDLNNQNIFYAIHYISTLRDKRGIRFLQTLLEKNDKSNYAIHAAYALLHINRSLATKYLAKMLQEGRITSWPPGPYTEAEKRLAIPPLKAALKRLGSSTYGLYCAKTLVKMGDPEGLKVLRNLCFSSNQNTIRMAEQALLAAGARIETAGVATLLHIHRNLPYAAQLAIRSRDKRLGDTLIMYIDKNPNLNRDSYGMVFSALLAIRDKRLPRYAREFIRRLGNQQSYKVFSAAMALLVSGEKVDSSLIVTMCNNSTYKRYLYAAN